MFTKTAIALAVLVGLASGAVAAPKHQQQSPVGGVHNSTGPTWQNPNVGGAWDPYGMRWD